MTLATNDPTTSHPTNATAAQNDLAIQAPQQPVRQPVRHGNETKASFNTTEPIAYVVAVVGILVASTFELIRDSLLLIRPDGPIARLAADNMLHDTSAVIAALTPRPRTSPGGSHTPDEVVQGHDFSSRRVKEDAFGLYRDADVVGDVAN